MDRLQALEVFVAVAEHRGFAAAGRALGLSAPAVTRAVAGLEAHLGARLFRRTTRSVDLTEAGARFHGDARRLLAELAEAERAAVGLHAAPQGLLRVTAPSLFGRLHIAPLLADFLDAHPAVTAEALFVDRIVDLMEEGIDVAVRIGDLADSGLTAVKVGAVRRVVAASPTCWNAYGRPTQVADLATLPAIHTPPLDAKAVWRFVDGEGRALDVPIAPRLRINSIEAARDLACQGRGMVRLYSYQLADALRDGRLEAVLQEAAPPPVPVHLLHREGRFVSSKLRAFVDFAAARLRADPALR